MEEKGEPVLVASDIVHVCPRWIMEITIFFFLEGLKQLVASQ